MQRRGRIALFVTAAGAVCALGYGIAREWPWRHIPDRVFRIGWQEVPPFQVKTPNGPAGIAIDLVREAARRRGIRLQWIYDPGSSEASVRSGKVDLWPLMTRTPERQDVIHITEPYMQHENVLLVRADSSYQRYSDLAAGPISHLDIPVMPNLVQRVLPDARLVGAASQFASMGLVCSHEAEAAFMDDFSAVTVLLGGGGCPGQPLREIPIRTLEIQLGVASSFDNARVADEIRDGISDLARNGEVEKILGRWGDFSPWNAGYVGALLEANRREKRLIAAVSVFALLLAIALFAIDRIRRQRNRIAATEQALRETEQKIRLMAANLKELVLSYDMDGVLTFANPAVTEQTGYTADELCDRDALCWVHQDDQIHMRRCWEQLFRGAAFRDEQFRLIAKDGSMRWVSATWGPIFDTSGRQVGVQRCERDITERRRAQEALHVSERRFRELLEGVHLAAIIINRDGNISFCNDYTLSVTGWSWEEVVGRPAGRLLDSEHVGWLNASLGNVGEAGTVRTYSESRIRTKDGGVRTVRWSSAALRDSEGRITGVASLGADVTELEHLRAEAARRESEARFRQAVDAAPVMIWMSGTDKGCTLFNKGWLDFTGRSMEQEIGDGWSQGVHPDDLSRCLSGYVTAFEKRVPFQIEYRLRRADGEYRWVFDSGVPRFEPDGAFAGYIGSCADITDLKRSQAEDLTRQKLESVGRLAAGIAHDFNNLLGGVLAYAEAATAELRAGRLPEAELNLIHNVSVRGAGIVRQLMIYAGQESPETELVDVSRVAGDMIELLQVTVSKHATLQSDFPPNLPAVRANPAQLQQLVMNLVSNASEAIGERDGVIRLSTSAAGDGFVQLEIADTGRGMDPDAQSRVFDPFFTTKSEGHGLGLSVVHGIVRALDGKIQIASEPGKGTAVRVLLPAVAAAMAAPPHPAPSAARPAPRQELRTILLVEDEETLRVPVAKMLRNRGWTVLEAPDGSAAMEVISHEPQTIGVVLLDLTLPGTPSRTVFEEVRRQRPDTKVVVTSAFGPNLADGAFPGLAMDAFIRKPYRLQELTSLLASVLAPQAAGIGQPAS